MKKLTFIQRVMLQHANPAKLTIDTGAMIVAAYFLWNHSLAFALILLFAISTIGTLVAWGRHEDKLIQTRLGRFMYGQAHPMNFLVRGIGALILGYGFWYHSFIFLLIAVVLIIISRHWTLKVSA